MRVILLIMLLASVVQAQTYAVFSTVAIFSEDMECEKMFVEPYVDTSILRGELEYDAKNATLNMKVDFPFRCDKDQEVMFITLGVIFCDNTCLFYHTSFPHNIFIGQMHGSDKIINIQAVR